MKVACLVGGDGIEPGFESSVRIEGVGREVDLKEGVLEDVLCRGSRAEEPMEELDEVGSVSLHERCKRNSVTFSIRHEKFLVGLSGVNCRRRGFDELLTNLILLLHRVAPAGNPTRKVISKSPRDHRSHDFEKLGGGHGEAVVERQRGHGARGTAVAPSGIV
jgi:hypothetical protein